MTFADWRHSWGGHHRGGGAMRCGLHGDWAARWSSQAPQVTHTLRVPHRPLRPFNYESTVDCGLGSLLWDETIVGITASRR